MFTPQDLFKNISKLSDVMIEKFGMLRLSDTASESGEWYIMTEGQERKIIWKGCLNRER